MIHLPEKCNLTFFLQINRQTFAFLDEGTNNQRGW